VSDEGALALLRTAEQWPLSVVVLFAGPINETVRSDGKARVHSVSVSTPPPGRRREWDMEY
jgi:hypothetical protein